MSWKKIMCPVDFSPGARDALQTAVNMSVDAGAELVLVYAWQPPIYTMGEGAVLAADLISDLMKDAEKGLAQWKADAEGMGARRVSTMLVSGAPGHEIADVAKRDPSFDLIVIGTHGRTGVKHVLLGSVAEKVIRYAPCPVLVVRARG